MTSMLTKRAPEMMTKDLPCLVPLKCKITTFWVLVWQLSPSLVALIYDNWAVWEATGHQCYLTMVWIGCCAVLFSSFPTHISFWAWFRLETSILPIGMGKSFSSKEIWVFPPCPRHLINSSKEKIFAFSPCICLLWMTDSRSAWQLRGAKAFLSITTEPGVCFSCAIDDVGHLWGDFS